MCKQTEKLKAIIKVLYPLAVAGEYHTGGKSEADAARNAQALAEARKVVRDD